MTEASQRIRDIIDEMDSLLSEARSLAKDKFPSMIPNWDAYVFEQIKEHLHKGNPYNTDLEDIANALDFEDDEPDADEDYP